VLRLQRPLLPVLLQESLMPRSNDFTRGVRIAVRLRATKNGVVYCEGCGLPTKDFRVDHRIAAGLRGSRKIENAWLLGKCCYAEKDAEDNAVVKRMGRIEAEHLGVIRKATTLRSRGFIPPAPKPSRCGPTSKTIPRRPF
jgi:hypothetical protein